MLISQSTSFAQLTLNTYKENNDSRKARNIFLLLLSMTHFKHKEIFHFTDKNEDEIYLTASLESAV